MQLFKTICNRPSKIWLPLAIVLLNGVTNFLAKQYLLAYLDLDLLEISPNIQVISRFFAIVGALIDWVLISTLHLFWMPVIVR